MLKLSPDGTIITALTAVKIPEKITSIGNKAFKNIDVTYESSNPEIISVDEDGTITALGIGTATITATATIDGEVIEDNVTVTSSYAWWQWIINILLFGWLWY